MASLYEYFVKDGSKTLTTHQSWTISQPDGTKIGDVTARLHYDFDAHAKYISFWIPELLGVECPEAMVLNKIDEILAWPKTLLGVISGFGSEKTNAESLVFTGRIYIYSERPVPHALMERMAAEAKSHGHNLVFRSTEYAVERSKWEKPAAFIAHDSRDKKHIAEPLALELQKLMCAVWYDEFSLQVGDSLREEIEKGLKECKKCILILTPNFLVNSGWSKKEYDSVFTRELVENQKVILPVWHDVSSKDVYQYSPALADRVALQWHIGAELVARKLLGVINS